MCVSETHLTCLVPNSFIDIPRYNVVRSDGSPSVAKHGVCMYIHSSIKYESVNVICPNCVTVYLPDLNLYVVSAYRPPSYSSDENKTLLDLLSRFCLDKEVLILGDFNLPSLSWNEVDTLSNISAMDRSFLETFQCLGLTQLVKEPTYPRSGNILDLILVSDQDRVGQTLVLEPLPGCDHCPTLCDYLFDHHSISSLHSSRPTRKWHKGKYNLILRELRDINWDFEFDNLSAHDAYLRLLEILGPLVDRYVPLTNGLHPVRIPWQTNPPSSLRLRRKTSWSRYKVARAQSGRHSTDTKQALATFFSVNKELRNFAVSSQAAYEKQLAVDMKTSPKLLHSYIRRKKVGCPSVGPLKYNQMLTDDPATMADMFASSFEAVYTSHANTNPYPHQTSHTQMDPILLQQQDVRDAISILNWDSATGPDDIHPALLKSCSEALVFPLFKVFSLSLSEARLPLIWKTSIVIPIYKKGSHYDPLNYRPISLTSVVCKCLERIIVKHLNSYLESHDILSNHQFGFRSGRSTQDQLLLVYDSITGWFDQGDAVDLILFDFAKAFDVVSHPILLSKLSCLGIDTRLIYWIEDFLSGRTMSVSVKGAYSSPRPVRSGVPQGSVLGPILFLVFINHIASHLSCQYKIFADDLKLFMRVNFSTTELYRRSIDHCQSDISKLENTASSWGLRLNQEKCATIRFQRKACTAPPPEYFISGTKIKVVDSHPDLGVLIDSDLKFHSHILNTAHKAGGLIHSLLKSTVCRSPDFMMSLFCTHVRPIIEYCSCVWFTGYVSDLRVLESLQRRWTKRIAGMEDLDYTARLKSLNQYSVQGRLMRADMILCWKIFHGKCSIAPTDLFTLAPQSGTRGHRYKVCHVRAATDVRKRSFAVRCAGPWNRLPDRAVAQTSLGTFKKMLSDILGETLFEYPV